MTILITGYPYVRGNFLKTFEFYPKGDNLYFFLPRTWKAKGGKVVFKAPAGQNIYTGRAFFYHSHYPIIGGLLKGWMPGLPWTLWKLRKKIGVMYTSTEPTLLTTLYHGLWARWFHIKHIVFTWENIDYSQKFKGLSGWIKRIILKWNLALADGLVCGNSRSAEIHRALTKKPIVSIPLSGVDSEYFKPGAKFDGGLLPELLGKTTFTFIGAIGYRKGLSHIVEALALIKNELPSAHCLIVGSGEYEPELHQLILDRHLEESVTRLPWADHALLKQILGMSDVFLYPSMPHNGWEEQFGYSIAEAALMELPVISTNSGSIIELIDDKKTGILIPPGDSQALARAMLALGQNVELRHAYGKAAREHIASLYSYTVVASKYRDFFRKIYGHED